MKQHLSLTLPIIILMSKGINLIQTVPQRQHPNMFVIFYLAYSLPNIIYSIKRITSHVFMFDFITSPQLSQLPSKSKDIHRSSTNRLNSLQLQIASIIAAMPPQEVCTQAAINVGLPSHLVDFDKILKNIDSQTSPNVLSFVLIQLKALAKESSKLQDYGYRCKTIQSNQKKKYQMLHSPKMSIRLDSLIEQEPKQSNDPIFEKKTIEALKQQMAFRVKLKKFYSTEKLQKKEQHLKQRAQKAKYMNKQALKKYKSYKQRGEHPQPVQQNGKLSKIDFSVMTPLEQIQDRKSLSKQQQILVSQCHPLINVVVVGETQKDLRQSKGKISQALKKVQQRSVFREIKSSNNNRSYQKGINNRGKKDLRNLQIQRDQERFAELHRRELETRQRKRQLQQQREATAILKLIRKQQKIRQISTADSKDPPPDKDNQQYKQHLRSSKSNTPEDRAIKASCQQKALKKQMQLKQKVNKIRQALKVKEERRERFKQVKQRQHEQQMQRNEQYIRAYNAKCRDNREQRQFRHEQAIRNRFQNSQNREKYYYMVDAIERMSDTQLNKQNLPQIRQMEKVKQKQFLKTLRSIVFLHVK